MRVELAFLEQMQPTLHDCVESLVRDGIQNIVIYPMFIATGTHLKKDLPALVQAVSVLHPSLKLSLQPAAGEQLAIQHAITRQALEYLNQS
jgi:sirohydrochlorin cobaltochelatase